MKIKFIRNLNHHIKNFAVLGLVSTAANAQDFPIGPELEPHRERIYKIAQDISGLENPEDPILYIAQDRYQRFRRNLDVIDKNGLDDIARAQNNSNFKNADYPFHDIINHCGPGQGALNTAVPERSTLVPGGPIYTEACDEHDRAYMTLGYSREQADQEMLVNLNNLVSQWLNENMSEVWNPQVREVKKMGTRLVEKKILKPFKRRVKVPGHKWVGRGPFKILVPTFNFKEITDWRYVLETVAEEFEEIVLETYMVREFLPRSALVGKAFEPILRNEVKIYHLAVAGKGSDSYDNSQRQERAYHEWLLLYEFENGIRWE